MHSLYQPLDSIHSVTTLLLLHAVYVQNDFSCLHCNNQAMTLNAALKFTVTENSNIFQESANRHPCQTEISGILLLLAWYWSYKWAKTCTITHMFLSVFDLYVSAMICAHIRVKAVWSSCDVLCVTLTRLSSILQSPFSPFCPSIPWPTKSKMNFQLFYVRFTVCALVKTCLLSLLTAGPESPISPFSPLSPGGPVSPTSPLGPWRQRIKRQCHIQEMKTSASACV